MFGATLATPAQAAFPVLDAASKCANAQTERSPDGYYLRTCYKFSEVSALSSERQSLLVVERFTSDGKLDSKWGVAGRATVPMAPDDACFTAFAGATAFFLPDGRTLIIPGNASRLRAFHADGVLDMSYGNGGASDRLCDPESSSRNAGMVSLDLLPDGRFVALSWLEPDNTNARGDRFFVGYRLLVTGLADPAFTDSSAGWISAGGRIAYNALRESPYGVKSFAWSLQSDNSLQVSYYNSLDGGMTKPFFRVLRQSPGDVFASEMPGRTMPQRGVLYHVDNDSSRFWYPDGSVYTLKNSLSYGATILPTGDLIVYPFNYDFASGYEARHFVRVKSTGELDTDFGEAGIAKVEFQTVPKGCIRQFGREEIFLQPDGSLIYTGDYVNFVSGYKAFAPVCPGTARGPFAVKLLPNGKFDSAFPQWQDPATSGANFISSPLTWTAVEYFTPVLNRYFFTPHPLEADYIDVDKQLIAQGWVRTGKTFDVWNPDSALPGSASACRFAADPIVPPRTFYDSLIPQDCDALRALERSAAPGERTWRYDRESFRAAPGSANGECPSTLMPVYSVYNRGFERGIDSNFRYVTSQADFDAMLKLGWIGELKPQFCTISQ